MTKDPYEHEPDRLIRNGFAACYRADGSLRWRWIGRPSERPAEREAITGDRTDVVVTGSRVTALGRRAILTEVRDTATGRIRWRGTYDGVDGNWVSTGGRDAFLWSRKVVIAGHVVLGLQTQKVQLIYAR